MSGARLRIVNPNSDAGKLTSFVLDADIIFDYISVVAGADSPDADGIAVADVVDMTDIPGLNFGTLDATNSTGDFVIGTLAGILDAMGTPETDVPIPAGLTDGDFGGDFAPIAPQHSGRQTLAHSFPAN